jgi:hypothetical protein
MASLVPGRLGHAGGQVALGVGTDGFGRGRDCGLRLLPAPRAALYGALGQLVGAAVRGSSVGMPRGGGRQR